MTDDPKDQPVDEEDSGEQDFTLSLSDPRLPSDETATVVDGVNPQIATGLGPESAWVGYSMTGLARVYRDAGRIGEAQATYRRALELMRGEWRDDDPDVRRAEKELAELEDHPAAD